MMLPLQHAPPTRQPVQVSRPSGSNGRGQHQTRRQQPRPALFPHARTVPIPLASPITLGSIGRLLAFGVMSEKMLAIFAGLSLAFVAVVLVSFWLVLGLSD